MYSEYIKGMSDIETMASETFVRYLRAVDETYNHVNFKHRQANVYQKTRYLIPEENNPP
jgi:hypothetical protein